MTKQAQTPNTDAYHESVLLAEVLDALDVVPGGRYIDATLGEGGHAGAILNAAMPGGQLLGIEADPEAVASASTRLEEWGKAMRVVNENFVEMRAIAQRFGFAPVNGILMDLGVSSLQLDRETRGFSFRRPDALDMRFSEEGDVDAYEIVNSYQEQDLADILYRYGDERASRRIASAIVRNRPIEDAVQLAEIVGSAKSRGRRGIHPATQTFQAIRIAVNDELAVLESALGQAIDLLGNGGRLVVISYHSLEDRIVKNFIRDAASDCICGASEKRLPVCGCEHQRTLEPVIDGALVPSQSEVSANPRSRSAKMRVARRI